MEIAVEADTYCLVQLLERRFEPLSISIEGTEVIIGRNTHRGLDRYAAVSEKYAILKATKSSEWWIEKADSSAVLYVNGRDIGSTQHKLKVGDIIGFGCSYEKNIFISRQGEPKYFVCKFLKTTATNLFLLYLTFLFGTDRKSIVKEELTPNVCSKAEQMEENTRNGSVKKLKLSSHEDELNPESEIIVDENLKPFGARRKKRRSTVKKKI